MSMSPKSRRIAKLMDAPDTQILESDSESIADFVEGLIAGSMQATFTNIHRLSWISPAQPSGY